MAQLIDIKKVSISKRSLTARIAIGADAPLYTGDDPEATERIAALIPQLAGHDCYGDGGQTFGEVMADTELAHLLEHVTVELLARTKRAGRVSAGQTRTIDERNGIYELRFACPDDVLVAGALSSAAWIVEWAYSGGGDPEPDVDAIAQGLAGLIESLEGAAADAAPAPSIFQDATSELEKIDLGATVATMPIAAGDAADDDVLGQDPDIAADASSSADYPDAPGEPAFAEDGGPAPVSKSNGELSLPLFDI